MKGTQLHLAKVTQGSVTGQLLAMCRERFRLGQRQVDLLAHEVPKLVKVTSLVQVK
jgi:hypothetical protein